VEHIIWAVTKWGHSTFTIKTHHLTTYEKITIEQLIRIIKGVEAYLTRLIFSDWSDFDAILMFEQDLEVMMCGYDFVAYRFKVPPPFKPNFVDDNEWLLGEMYLDLIIDCDLTIKTGKLVM